MSKIIFFIGFVCVLQLTSCHVVREAPAEPIVTLKDLTDKAATAYDTLHENVLKFANVSSDDELKNLVRTQSDTYADKLKTFAVQLTDEVKANSDKFDGFFKSITDVFNSAANELKEKNPELASFQTTIEKSIKSVLEESEKLSAKVTEDGQGLSENAKNIMKKVYEDTFEVASKVAETLSTAAKKD